MHAARIHRIYLTPRPTVVVLMGTIKLSVQWRGEFIAVRKNDSNENIDQEGARTLLGRAQHRNLRNAPPQTDRRREWQVLDGRKRMEFCEMLNCEFFAECLKLDALTDFRMTTKGD